jgi:monovalent cation/hydrogen antiporter
MRSFVLRLRRSHLSAITQVADERPRFCEECHASERDGVLLRACLTCGNVGCAEGSSANHAAEHYAETDHPVAEAIGSAPPSRWCYPDRRVV